MKTALSVAALTASAALIVFATVAFSAERPVSTYAEGAPAGFSGGFGESSCHACHFDAPPDSGPGRVQLTGVPEVFVAGEQYPIGITLTRPGMSLAGFQITARFKEGGAQAGTLAPAAEDVERVGVDVFNDVQYVSQRKPGTTLTTPDTATWALIWTAPQTNGPVVFNTSANAANGDETVSGDYVHTLAVEAAPAVTISAAAR